MLQTIDINSLPRSDCRLSFSPQRKSQEVNGLTYCRTKDNSTLMLSIIAYAEHFFLLIFFFHIFISMKEFFIKCLSQDNTVSSKRVITFFAFIAMLIGFMTNLFWAKIMDQNMFDSMKWIVIYGLGFTASEQIFNKIPLPTQTPTTEPPSDK